MGLPFLTESTWKTGASSQISKAHPKHLRKRSEICNGILDSWNLNYAALLLSSLSLTSLWALLGYYDGRALSDWSYPLGTSINTVLAVIATIMKGSVLLATASALAQSKWTWFYTSKRRLQDFRVFDEASRGFIGAAELLWRLRAWHVASIGAMVVLLSLLSDILVQASITTSLRSANLGDASIPICTSYSAPDQDVTADGIASSTKSAIYSAVYNGKQPNGPSSQIAIDCSSGNCVFPAYASLGVCSDCTNITSELTGLRHNNITFYWNEEDILVLPENFTVHFEGDAGPELVGIISPNGTTQTQGVINMTATTSSLMNTMNGARGVTINLANTTVVIMDEYSESYHPVHAYQCGLQLCARTYDTTVKDGKLVESVSEVFTAGWNIPPYDNTTAFLSKASLEVSLLTGEKQQMVADLDIVAFLISYFGGLPPQNLFLPDFNGANVFTGHGEIIYTNGSAGVNQTWTNELIEGIAGVELENTPQTFDSLAASMTADMRTQCNERALGTAQGEEPYIKARLPFMILPTLMVMLAVVFVVSTSHQSRAVDLPEWGTSALANVVYAGGVAFHITEDGGSEGMSQRPEIMLQPGDLDAWAEGKVARLRFREYGEKGRI